MLARSPRRAFTLVELLVVLAIIALLIAILMPALRKAKEAANAAKCQTNLRALGQAFLMFAQDHNNYLPGNKHDTDYPGWFRDGRTQPYPPNEDWKTDWLAGRNPDPANFIDAPKKGTIWPYVKNKSLFVCPTEESSPTIRGGAGTNARFDYACFGSLPGAKLNKLKKDAQFKWGSKIELVPLPMIVQEDPRWINGSNLEGGHSYPDQMAHCHSKGSYYVTTDASVHFFAEPDLYNVVGANNNWSAIAPSGKRKSLGEDHGFGWWNNQ